MKKYTALCVTILAILVVCGFGYQPTRNTLFETGNVGAIIEIQRYIGGETVYGPSNLVDNNTNLLYKNAIIPVTRVGTVTTTTATTAPATITGVSATSNCQFSATNTSASALTPFVTATTNTATLTFGTAPAAGATFNISCVN